MESTIVIKVKHGDTLRRFNARVLNDQLDLNMEGLRGKIFSLFNFAPDAELVLTYIDEDGDVVTLADDEDLHDVVRQALNPLRITVNLKTEKRSKQSARSSGSSTPMRSPRVQHPLQNLNSGVSEILKSIPEPLRESFSKLSSELSSRATSTAPNLVEIVDSFSKLGLSYLNQLSEVQAGAVSNDQGEASKDPDGSKVSVDPVDVSSNVKSEEPKSKLEAFVAASGAAVTNLNQPVDGSQHASGSKPSPFKGAESKKEEVKNQHFYGFSKNGLRCFGAPPVASKIPISNIKDGNRPSETHVDAVGSSSGLMNWIPINTPTMDLNGGIKKQSSGGLEETKVPRLVPSQMNECPFTGLPIGNETAIPEPAPPHGTPFKRSYSLTDGIFHRGVRCDGCGMHPITGPRFKSKVKEDYDLCSICFYEFGNDVDYMRIDRPPIHRHPLSFRGLYDHHARVRPPTLPHILRGPGMKPSRPKLDSRFIQDVNILDGTIMAPSTRFTKIWRMRNNGTIVWPQGSQLVWIGGDRLSDALSVELEIAAAGLPVDQELDVAVDFVAPELPGRYISYWRTASPTGQKFGQRVWVLIQVDASMKEPVRETIHGFNLNWPPASDSATAPEVENTNAEPMVEDNLSGRNNVNILVETGEPVVNADVKEKHEANFPINNSLLVGGTASNPSPSVPSSLVSYPIIDLTEEVTPAAPTPVPAGFTFAPPSSEEVKEDKDVEVTLLKELEEMGFKQIDLNKKVLRMNQYDLEQSVDDLCGVSEWDPMLEELEEMGFHDKEMNMKLLKKNNGSIKRVVMDLISGETL